MLLQDSFLSDINHGFEWFYFDIHSKDNIDIVVTFHRRAFNIAFDLSLLDIFYYKDNIQIAHEAQIYKDDQIHIRTNPFEINYPAGYIKSNNNQYEIVFKNNKTYLSLTIKKSDISWNPQMIDLFAGKNIKDDFFWCIWEIKGEAIGQIKILDKTYHIEGIAYHDQNWGTVIFNKYLKKWDWGKYFFDNGALIYGDIKFIDGKSNQYVVYNHKKDCIFFDNAVIENSNNYQKFLLNKQELKISIFALNTIEKISFNINRLPYKYKLFRKLIEFILVNLYKYRPFKFLYNIIANTHYKRVKASFSLDNKTHALSFHEEMVFK